MIDTQTPLFWLLSFALFLRKIAIFATFYKFVSFILLFLSQFMRRKQPKIAEYFQLPKCFYWESQTKGKWKEIFQNDLPITFELGCGTAELSFGLAKQFSDRNFVGVDLKPARLWQPAKKMQLENISNMAFWCGNLLQITNFVDENEADELWITFPDPFPKRKQSKHRMINPPFLKLYRQILKPKGKVHFKTDNLDLFLYALEVFVAEGNIRFHTLSFDLHSIELAETEVGTKTAYEKKFMAQGIKINYVCFSFTDK